MRKLRTFWHVFKHSVVPLDYYYHKILTTPFSFSFKYFVTLVVGVVLVGTILNASLFIREYPPEKLSFLVETLEQDFPDELVIRINEMGRLSTNYDKPFVLFSPLDSNPQPLIVVDAKAHKDKVFEYGSRVLMAERYMVIRIKTHLYTIYYQENEPLSLNKTDVMNITRNALVMLESYWMGLIVVVLATLLIAPLIIILSHVFILAIISFITFVILKLSVKRKSCTFLNIYQISLHSVTVPLITASLVCIFGFVPAIPYWYLMLNYIFLAGGVYEAYFAKP